MRDYARTNVIKAKLEDIEGKKHQFVGQGYKILYELSPGDADYPVDAQLDETAFVVEHPRWW